MTDDIELPAGFDDAPEPMKYDVLTNKRSKELVAAIRDELGRGGANGAQLSKGDKAAVLLALRDSNPDE